MNAPLLSVSARYKTIECQLNHDKLLSFLSGVRLLHFSFTCYRDEHMDLIGLRGYGAMSNHIHIKQLKLVVIYILVV